MFVNRGWIAHDGTSFFVTKKGASEDGDLRAFDLAYKASVAAEPVKQEATAVAPEPVVVEEVETPDFDDLDRVNDFINRAQTMIDRGCRYLIPLRVKSKLPIAGFSEWQNKATADLDILRGWNSEDPARNVGIVFKAEIGTPCCFESDSPEWDSECQKFGFFTVRSAKGHHYYMLHTASTLALGNVAQGDKNGQIKNASFRADNQYCLSPGSVHPDGPIYEIVRDVPMQSAPEEFVRWIAGQRNIKSESVSTDDGGSIASGGRNNRLTSIGGKLRHSGLNYTEIHDALRRINSERCTPPLPDGEVETIARSVSGYPIGKDESVLIGGRLAGTAPVASAIAAAPAFDADEYKKAIAASVSGESYVEDEIPEFDPSVINGIYQEFVELICRGTTMAPQFAYVIAKTVVGLRMAGRVKFETIDAEPRYYTALIGETGSGKGESWRRMLQILQPAGGIGGCKMKIINSIDSGAGVKDLFFEVPEEQPIICYVDEVVGLGNKAKATKNPEILDTIIELANSTTISRTLANRGKEKRCKTKGDARLAVVMCGQEGEVYTEAFAGRTKMGLWDRLYPEYSVPVEAGDLPAVPLVDAINLLTKFNSLDYSGTVTISDEARTALEAFWSGQPREVRTKARFRTNLLLDAYMSAFGRGSRLVEAEDAAIAMKIFTRQLVIRRVHFRTEIPDQVGKYIGRLKKITERMTDQIAGGVEVESVAKSRRDFERECHSYRDNEGHIFERAWSGFARVYLQAVTIETKRRSYIKYVPAADD
jgi:hypothetical protein